MQVVPSIAMAETYTRLLLIAPHSLFRSHFSVIFFNSKVSVPSLIILISQFSCKEVFILIMYSPQGHLT